MSLYYFVHCIVFYSLFDARPWSGNVPRDRCLQGTGRCETEDTGIRENARADGLHQTDAINCTTRWTASILQYSCCHDTCCTTYPTTRPLRRWRCRPRHRPHNFRDSYFGINTCKAFERGGHAHSQNSANPIRQLTTAPTHTSTISGALRWQ